VSILLLFLNIYSSINISNPTRDILNSYYIRTINLADDVNCSKGVNITWSTNVSNLNNQILAFSSSHGETIPICYRYNGIFYGTTCGTCASQINTDYPKYINQSVTIYIPFRGVFSDYNNSTATSISFGVDCGLLSGTSSCNPDNRLNNSTYDIYTSFTVNVDNIAPSGFSKDFDLFRSNASVYIDNFDIKNIKDNVGGSGLRYIRFYYAECGAFIDKTEAKYVDFVYDSKQAWKLRGLENEVSYSFGVSIIDNVGNEYPGIEDGFLEDENGFEIKGINVEDNTTCVVPTEVLGFIDHDERCFIASEIFGTKSKEVFLFRNFRNTSLSKYTYGKVFIKNYYKYSPRAVKFIRKNIFLKIFFYYYLKVVYNILND